MGYFFSDVVREQGHVPEAPFGTFLANEPNSFVGEEFDAFTDGILEGFGDGVGVPVRVFVETIEQGEAVGRADRLAVEQGSGGLEGG